MNNDNLIPAKEGEKRNPKGRGKGSKNWSSLFKKYAKLKISIADLKKLAKGKIDLPIDYPDNKKLTIQDIITMRLVYKAMLTGDYKHIELLINRMDGLLTQKHKITDDMDNLSEDDIKKELKLLRKRQNVINEK